LLLLKLLQILGFALGGVVVSILCNSLLLRFSESLGIRNKNDVVIRWSNQSKPSLGGISFFIVFVFSAFAYSVIFFDENIFHNKQYVGLFTASGIAFFMGLADDAYNTKPLAKLFVQISCGVIFVLTGTIIDLSHIYWLDTALTIFWVVAVMNSLNMLDNMDGITGTTVLFILLSCLIGGWIIFDFNTNIWTLTLVSVIGSIFGFLRYNIHPSKLFMGDAGSQFIGLFVAFFGVKFLWNVSSETESNSWASIIVTLVAFTPAAADTLTVVINRLKKGKSPMVGGKDHTTHHLVYAGFNDKQVWYVFLAIGFISCILSLAMINLIQLGIIVPIIFFSVYFLIVFAYLYRNTIKFPQKK
jgi:UDP-GlcNAc:undecaprenyl-phosphate GlcNAc-1-phosphate transferase